MYGRRKGNYNSPAFERSDRGGYLLLLVSVFHFGKIKILRVAGSKVLKYRATSMSDMYREGNWDSISSRLGGLVDPNNNAGPGSSIVPLVVCATFCA